MDITEKHRVEITYKHSCFEIAGMKDEIKKAVRIISEIPIIQVLFVALYTYASAANT